MACTYKVTDSNGKPITLRGEAEFKAYLADGNLPRLMEGGRVLFSKGIDNGESLDFTGSESLDFTGGEHGKNGEGSYGGIGQVQRAVEKLPTTVGGKPAAEGWSRATSVRGENGPTTIYRGASRPLESSHFQIESLGKNTGGTTPGLGVFFSDSNAEAGRYGKVEVFHLDIRNPYVIRSDRLPKFETIQDANNFQKKLISQGYDGIMLDNQPLGKKEIHFVAFHPEQVIPKAEADKAKANILASRASKFKPVDTNSPEFKRWSNDAPLIASSKAGLHTFKTGEKVVVEAYHGAGRPDRIGTAFLKKRATSGPMAFFTSDPELASGYAKGKQDTSRSLEDNPYESWFKYKPQGQRTPTDIVRAWYSLDSETKAKIAENAPKLRNSDDGNHVEVDEHNTSGNGSYDYNLEQTQRGYDKRGNPLKALVEDWLNSGTLFNNELLFMEVLKKAGFPIKDVTYDSPYDTFPFVFKSYVRMQKPLVTSDISSSVVDALQAAAKRDRSRAVQYGADIWDKNTRTLREWYDEFSNEDTRTHVWTSIPDKVTKVLSDLGYDGIIDESGKHGGEKHPVYIPFEEAQVKSAISNTGSFSETKNFLASKGEELANPHTPDTLRSSIAKAFSPKFIEKLEQTGRFEIVSNAEAERILNQSSSFESRSNGLTGNANRTRNGADRNSIDEHLNGFVDVPRNSELRFSDVDSSANKGGTNSEFVNPQRIADLLESKTFRVHGFGGIDVKTQDAVLKQMLMAGENSKVIDSVVRLIPVDMMNVLRSQQLSPEVLFHDKSMLLDALTGNGVFRGNVSPMAVSDFIRKTTSFGAEVAGIIGNRKSSFYGENPAVSASDFRTSSDPDSNALVGAKSPARGGGAMAGKGEYLSTSEASTIDSRHGVTPNSDVKLGAGGVEASSASPIVPSENKGRIKGFYDRSSGKTYIVYDNISKKETINQIKSLLVHEIGEHALQLGKTDKEYQSIQRDLEQLIKDGDKEAVAARQRAIDADTPAADIPRETMGYLVEAAPTSSIVQRFMTFFKAMVNKVLGPARLNWAYSPADMATMAQSALRRAPEMLGKAPEGGGALGSSSRKDWYRSALADAISTVPAKVDNTSGNNWATWITANASKLGVKKEEIQWSGITDYLAMRGKDKVSKEDVAAFLNESGVKVQDVVLGIPRPKRPSPGLPSDYEVQQTEYQYLVRDAASGLSVDIGKGIVESEREAREYAKRYFWNKTEELDDADRYSGLGDTKYSKYTVPGGENYREMLITLPTKKTTKTFEQWTNENFTGEDTPNARRIYKEQIDENSPYFQSSHFDQPNILAHLRFDDRTDSDGKRVLFINEVQSDWAQKGRKEGFVNPKVAEAKANFAQWMKDNPTTNPAVWREQNPDMVGLIETGREVPNAPFVTDTKAWTSIALKRAIAYAAENGYDKVAIINGEQAAGLYDLSKQIDSIRYHKSTDGKVSFDAIKDDSHVLSKNNISLSEVEDFLGKDIAKKMDSGDGEIDSRTGQNVLSGLDLKVGGAGMHKFYDEIIPQVANDVLRKIGGGKVEQIRLSEDSFSSKNAEYDDKLLSDLGVEVVGTRPAAQSGFTITDSMRENAAKGLPLFSKQEVAENKPPAIPEETRLQKAQRKIQDKLNRFTVIKEWLAENGVKLSEAADVYKAEERMHSKFANKAEDFREKRVAPLIQKIQKAGFSMETVAEFLHAQHAEERNKQIAKINPEKPDGGSGMTTAKANEILSKADPKLVALANEFRQITDQTKDLLLKEGIITQEMSDAWNKTYEHYVPLKGGPEEGIIQGTGKGLKAKRTLKRAMGHGEREGGEWIIENILADYERALMLVEKNRVGRSLIRLILEAGREDIGTIGKPEKRGVIKPDQAAYVVRFNGSMIESFNNLLDAKAYIREESQKYDREKNEYEIEKVQGDPSVHYMASPMLADNEVNVYVNGHAIRVQINDELLARAYGNMGAEALNTILQAGRALNGFLSKIYTGYNPEFILTNIIRDFTTGIINITGEQGVLFAAKAVLNYAGSFKDLLVYAATGQETKWITDYRADGGNTGAAYLSDLERLGSDIKSEYAAYLGTMENLKKGDYAGASRAAGRTAHNSTLKWIEHLNQAGENAMRLSIYKAAIESNMSRNKASSLAKNSTVNFNRKGEIRWVGALYLFFNAGVQGTASLAHAHFKGEHKYQAWGLSTAMASLGYLLAATLGGGDEEEYDKLSDFVKSRNLVVKAGDGWVKIPVPYGYGFFWNTGRAMADAARKDKWGKAPWHVASSFVEEFTPFGSAVSGGSPDSKSLLYLTPTIMQMTGAPIVNRTGMGGPIMPESKSDKSQPDRDKMWRSTKGTMYDSLAGALDKAGLDVSPETLKHYGRSLTGGAGALVDTSISSTMLKAQDAELDVNEMPFVRKFYGETTISDSRRAYYEARDEAKSALEEFNRAKKARDMSRAEDILKEKGELIALARYAARFSEQATLARDREDQIRLSDMPVAEKRLQLKQMEKDEEKIYDRYLQIFKEKTKKH